MTIALTFVVVGLGIFAAGMVLWSRAEVGKPDPNYGRGIGLAASGIILWVSGLMMLPPGS